jgi:HD-GYP domain-containing protein (c-di-GMP phosphodiesterase class II)/DNA-binding CsgD family transcriptional regulator
VAVGVAERLGLGHAEVRDSYYAAMLRSLGCTAFSHEVSEAFGGDDVAFHHLIDRLDPGHVGELLVDVARHMGAWAPPRERAAIAARFLGRQFTMAPRAARAACETSVTLATRLGLSPGVQEALAQVYERWDGRGIPDRLRGERLTAVARVVHLADIVEIAHREGGLQAAIAVARRRRGGHFDPAVADAFLAAADELVAPLETGDAGAAALAAEPRPHTRLPAERLEPLTEALGDVADLKSVMTLGHSRAVAALAGRAAADGEARELRLAAHVHDLGRIGVPTGLWEKPGPLSAAEWERVRLYTYYGERTLLRSPVLAGLAPLAAGHQERLDGSGYHRGLGGGALAAGQRLLAAADAFQAMLEPRAHRPARHAEAAADELSAETRAGRLCPQAVDAVLAAAGAPRRAPATWPHGLTDREVEVLRLLARGHSNKGIAAELVVSPRTVQHHVAHVYDKIGRRTRAGAALFAVEHGLLSE